MHLPNLASPEPHKKQLETALSIRVRKKFDLISNDVDDIIDKYTTFKIVFVNIYSVHYKLDLSPESGLSPLK